MEVLALGQLWPCVQTGPAAANCEGSLDSVPDEGGWTKVKVMETYSSKDFEGIAAAIEKEVGEIVKYKQFFEWAADWYRLDCGLPRKDLIRPYRPPPSKRREKLQRIRPGGTPPSKMREKVQRIAKSARQLLNDLGITTIEEAFDGPGHFELLEILAAVEVPSEGAVVNATRRVGQFATMMDAVEATVELEHRSLKASGEVLAEGKLTVPKGHQGDIAVNNWIATMMEIYRRITGVEPATSVGQVGRPDQGIASGPLIRFLQAASERLGMKYSEDAWRSRVRTILQSH